MLGHCLMMLFLHLNALENAVNAKNQHAMQVVDAGHRVMLGHHIVMLFLQLNVLENAVEEKDIHVVQVLDVVAMLVLGHLYMRRMTSKPIWLTCLTFETV